DFRVEVVDLPDGDAGQGPLIGYTSGTTVQLDVNAGGLGWFVDPTPGDDSEFAGTGDVYALRADGGPAAGQMDLLTVVMHELGHGSGWEAGHPGGAPQSLWDEPRPRGTRRPLAPTLVGLTAEDIGAPPSPVVRRADVREEQAASPPAL